jgi:hypothetical protein
VARVASHVAEKKSFTGATLAGDPTVLSKSRNGTFGRPNGAVSTSRLTKKDVMYDTIHSVARTLNDAGALKFLFPLLTILGPAILGYFGYLGVARRRTLVLYRNRRSETWWVTGPWALACGLSYLVLAPILLVAMGPVATAMFGLW